MKLRNAIALSLLAFGVTFSTVKYGESSFLNKQGSKSDAESIELVLANNVSPLFKQATSTRIDDIGLELRVSTRSIDQMRALLLKLSSVELLDADVYKVTIERNPDLLFQITVTLKTKNPLS